ncbi:hypothetical protein KY285_005363 [Solanum tuberosum]|nr:hypothetical protein KY285_005363 [Solanum tuberosum]
MKPNGKRRRLLGLLWVRRLVGKDVKLIERGAVIDGWRMDEEVTLETAGYCRFPAVHGRFFGSERWAIDERGRRGMGKVRTSGEEEGTSLLFLEKEEDVGEGETFWENMWPMGIVLILGKDEKLWYLIWAVRSFDRTVGKNREFKNK